MRTVLRGLLDTFVISIYQLPSSNAIKILSILVTFLQNHYKKPYLFEPIFDMRWMVRKIETFSWYCLDCFFNIFATLGHRLSIEATFRFEISFRILG